MERLVTYPCSLHTRRNAAASDPSLTPRNAEHLCNTLMCSYYPAPRQCPTEPYIRSSLLGPTQKQVLAAMNFTVFIENMMSQT